MVSRQQSSRNSFNSIKSREHYVPWKGNLLCGDKKKIKGLNSEKPRKIYIGKVPQIEEDPEVQAGTSSRWSGAKTTRESLGNTSFYGKDAMIDGSQFRRTIRRNSSTRRSRNKASLTRVDTVPRQTGQQSSQNLQEQIVDADQHNASFPSNYIKTSRYTLITFLPKNIFEQFRRLVNFFFLTITLLMIVISTSEDPTSSILGLCFVLTVTAIKQGYEDWLRHKADAAVNNKKVKLVSKGELKTVTSKDIRVGHIIRLEVEDPVPADVLVLASSDDFHRCQVTTANLDGETNLKMRYCPPGVPAIKNPSDFNKLNAVLECEQPNSRLYSFNGNLLLLQGTFSEDIGSYRSKDSTRRPLPQTSDSLGKRIGNAIKDSIRSKLSVKFDEETDDEILSSSEFVQIPLTMENMILRGTNVKNTDYVYGVVVYTGNDTRLAQNSKKTSTKFATSDRSINQFLYVILSVLAVVVSTYTGLHFVFLNSDIIESAWYLPPEEEIDAWYIVTIAFSFLVVFSYIIPLSLYVTVELQTFIGSKYFVWDKEMKDPVTGPALCNTSDVNEELGQIQYLFSDKTGTLTENIMEFRHCSVNGIRYKYRANHKALFLEDGLPSEEIKVDLQDPDNSELLEFLRTLALCHTVQVLSEEQLQKKIHKGSVKKVKPKKNTFFDFLAEKNRPPSTIITSQYQASSPDELALVEACAELGIKLLGEENEVITLDVLGNIESYKRHFVLEFDSDRKCMSVILEDSSGEIFVLSKGAESSIFQKSISGNVEMTRTHVDEFAYLGLRTLAIAQKKITKDELEQFSTNVNKARRVLKNREEKMRELYKSIESNLHVIGATGVEDQLQEGVCDTLTALGEAGIKVWVLTGDKVETAVNVAIACGLLTSTSKQAKLTGFTSGYELEVALDEMKAKGMVDEETTFIIDGESLGIAFKCCSQLFCEIMMQAGRVVCCRLAPLQKAQVVKMVKDTKHGPITAAVGDGANDVAMIQEAHIGLGIFGKEGRQAARSADFAIGRFSFLKKAILVHGHWFYVRISILIQYFFYKNAVLVIPQAFAAFYTAFSSQSLIDVIYMTFYNIVFTSVPILAYAIQEQPYSSSTLLSNPSLYKRLSCNNLLSWKTFGYWMLRSLYHSVIIYYFPLYSILRKDTISNWDTLGLFVATLIVIACNIILVAHTRYFTGLIAFGFVCSFVGFFGVSAIYLEAGLGLGGTLDYTFFNMQTTLIFWLNVLFITVLVLVPEIVLKYSQNILIDRKMKANNAILN